MRRHTGRRKETREEIEINRKGRGARRIRGKREKDGTRERRITR